MSQNIRYAPDVVDTIAGTFHLPDTVRSQLHPVIRELSEAGGDRAGTAHVTSAADKFTLACALVEYLRRVGCGSVVVAASSRGEQSRFLSTVAAHSRTRDSGFERPPRVYTSRTWIPADTPDTDLSQPSNVLVVSPTPSPDSGHDDLFRRRLSESGSPALISIDDPANISAAAWLNTVAGTVAPSVTMTLTTSAPADDSRDTSAAAVFPQMTVSESTPDVDVTVIPERTIRDAAVTLFTIPEVSGEVDAGMVAGQLSRFLAGKSRVPKTVAAARSCAHLVDVFLTHVHVETWTKKTVIAARERLDILLQIAVNDAYVNTDTGATIRPVKVHTPPSAVVEDEVTDRLVFVPGRSYATHGASLTASAVYDNWGQAMLARALGVDEGVDWWLRVHPDRDTQLYVDVAPGRRHFPDFLIADVDGSLWSVDVVEDSEFGSDQTWDADTAVRKSFDLARDEGTADVWEHITVPSSWVSEHMTLEELKVASGAVTE